MPSDRTLSILDLGQACAANVDFWSRFNCRIQIEDLYAAYTELAASESETDLSSFRLLSCAQETKFDVILAWDLFNYFSIETLGRLVQRLAMHCLPGTLLFAGISFQAQIPAVPTRFKIADPGHLVYELGSTEVRSCPRHQPRDVARLMSQFHVAHSFLLRHGIQEYVFAFK